LLTEAVYRDIAHRFDCELLGAFSLKGKAALAPIYNLQGRKI